jgi:hypothetical protein
VSKETADIIYDIGRPVHRKVIRGLLAQDFVQEPSKAYETIGRTGYDHCQQFIG